MIAPEMPSETGTLTTSIIVIVPVQEAFSLFTRRSDHRLIHGFRLSTQALITPALYAPDFPNYKFLSFWTIHLLVVWAAVYRAKTARRHRISPQ